MPQAGGTCMTRRTGTSSPFTYAPSSGLRKGSRGGGPVTQPGDANQQAISYMQYQGAKGLKELAGLVERTAADWSRCLEDISEEQAEFKPVLSGVEGPVLSGVEGPPPIVAAAEGPEWCVKEVLGHFLEATH